MNTTDTVNETVIITSRTADALTLDVEGCPLPVYVVHRGSGGVGDYVVGLATIGTIPLQQRLVFVVSDLADFDLNQIAAAAIDPGLRIWEENTTPAMRAEVLAGLAERSTGSLATST